MLNDSNSLQSDYNNLVSWLKLPETQEVLALLNDRARQLSDAALMPPPATATIGSILHREQNIGESRGVKHLQQILDERKRDLEIRLGLIKDETITLNENA